MRFSAHIGCVLYLMYAEYVHGSIQGILQQGRACFKVREISASCNKTLTESFQPRNEIYGGNKPTSLIFLFTPSNPDVAEPLHLCGGGLPENSNYDPEADTEVFIHGWLDGICRTAWMREMKEQLKIRGRYNVILADWTWGNTPDYVLAGYNSKIIGEQVGFVINNIMKQTGVGPEKFHLIGHSFGAIASGFVGRSVNGLRRITALDPAFAPYGDAPPDERVTYRDAELVDVIHTNAFDPGCFALGIGDPRQLGHADFYPNGGLFQASCYPYIFTSILKGDILYGISQLEPRLCSHNHAIQYYKVSINPKDCQFIGKASDSYSSFKENEDEDQGCQDTAVMGMDYEKYLTEGDTEGKKYYLDTLLFCPYCEGDSCQKG